MSAYPPPRPRPGPRAATGLPRFDLQRFAVEERTLPATPRHRQRARERGQVAKSADLGAAAVLLCAWAAVAVAGPAAARGFAGWTVQEWGHLPAGGLDIRQALATLWAGGRAVALLAAPVLLAGALGATAVGVAQTGFVLSVQPLAPDLTRIDPVRGLGRLFSRRALVELAKAVVKAGAIGAAAWGPCWALLTRLVASGPGAPVAASWTYAATSRILLRAGLILLALGVMDLAYQRYENEVTLRMSRQEVRQEMRESEGDPAARARRRRRQRELARRRALAEVRQADVVVANPTHFAVALQYDEARMAAPLVVARGADLMAERIKAVARAAGVLIVENPPLARSLYGAVKEGQHIPASLYKAVAEVLAFVWRVRGRSG